MERAIEAPTVEDGLERNLESGVPLALDLVDTVVQYRWQALLVFFLVTLSGVFYAAVAPSVYLADALLQVEDKRQNPVPGVQQIAQALNVGENNIQGEVEILRSRDVVGKAIDALSLDIDVSPLNRAPVFADLFERHVGGKGIYLAPARFGLVGYQWGGESVVVSELAIPPFYEGRPFYLTVTGSATWSLADASGAVIATGQAGTPTFFAIAGGTGKIVVKKIFARLGDKFTVTKLNRIAAYKHIASSFSAVETVKQSGVIRVTYAARDPSEATDVLNEITKAYVDQNISRGAEDASKALAFLETQLPQLKQTMESSEAALSKYQISRQSISLDKEASSLLDRSVNLGKSKLDAEMKRGQLLQVFKPDHPQVQAVDQEIRQIQGDEGELAAEIKRLPDTQQGLLALSRDMKINTDIYTSLLASAEQYKVAKAGTIGNVRVVDSAAATSIPTKPNRPLLVGLAMVAGILVAVSSCVFRRSLRPYFRSSEDVEHKVGLPVYGTIPESKLQSNLSLRKRSPSSGPRLLHTLAPTDLAIESLRSLSVAIQFAMSSASQKNVLITGPTSSLGKSFVSANLGAVMGASGKKVLLVDTDLRRPRLHHYFSIPQIPGLSDMLAGRYAAGEILAPAVSLGVDLVTAGTIPPNPSELLVNGRLVEFLAWAQERYDYVIFDSPPLLPVGDAAIISKFAAAIFMVLRFETSTPAEARESLRRLDNVGAKVNGIIFNGLALDRLRYGYQYKNYYSYS